METKSTLAAVAQRLLKSALEAVDPQKALLTRLHLQDEALTVSGEGAEISLEWNLRVFDRLWILGAGKASVPMAEACEKVLGDRVTGGLIVTKKGQGRKLAKVRVIEAGHPVPDRDGLQGAREIITLLEGAEKTDLILFLTSGGCSALLPAPAPPVSLADKQKLTSLLLRSGAAIQEINRVRKHLSLSKGGQLARAARPATVLNLIISDVVGDDLATIGSGPFVADPSTYHDAWQVLQKFRLTAAAPGSVIQRLREGMKGRAPETPKPGDPCFRRVRNIILADNRRALLAAAYQARSLGFPPLILTSRLEGEVGTLAKLYGALAREIRGLPGTVFLSAGTDGTDGPTEAAGGRVDGRTVARALRRGIDPEKYLAENDSYHFFREAGGLLVTGPTGTNVMDIHILLVG